MPPPGGPAHLTLWQEAPALFHLLERARPVGSEQPRQRAIREQLATRLALRAVVGLAVSKADALHGRAAVGAGLAVAAVHGHARPEGRHALGELAGRRLSQPHGPVVERRPRRVVEARMLAVAQRPRLPDRRELCLMQDLVRVRVADAGEDVRVRERALERVALARDGRAELFRRARERLDTAGIERG